MNDVARKNLLARCTFTTECLEEDIPYVGNCSAMDDETDKANEDWIRDQLDRGNEWAWCCVRVTATFATFKGTDYLGGCSYLSQKDFEQPGDYYDDMKHEAFNRLVKAIDEAKQSLAELGL